MKYKYVIGSGWWCAEKEADTRQELLGDDSIRGKEFHQLWYQSVCKYSSPTKILIVDSASPIKPDINPHDPRIELLSLDVNAGHSTNHSGKFCGYVRAIQAGMMYALQCEVDYYVYVEQDALLFGDDVIDKCIEKMATPYMFGSSGDTPQPIQQSLFIIHKDGILPFLKRLNGLSYTDNEICPEKKFHLVCSKGPVSFLGWLSFNLHKNKLAKWFYWQAFKYLRNYDYLPMGYGRTRPINFDDEQFYFQHGELSDLEKYLRKTGFKGLPD